MPGIVTARRNNGFYMQDPTPDADPATVRGHLRLHQLGPDGVAVGDSVLVSGTVDEFRPTAVDGPNLTVTEITGPTIGVVSSGNPLPAADRDRRRRARPSRRAIDDDPIGERRD